MKIYRVKHKGEIFYGTLEDELIFALKGSIFAEFKTAKTGIPIGQVTILPPVEPSKVVAIGTNYRDHAREMNKPLPEEPLLFLKPPSAVIGPLETIVYPAMSKRVDYEGELALIIKKETSRLNDDADVHDHILGYTCFNDVTARDLQFKDIQFTRAKSFDTFAAAGPCIATDIDAGNLALKAFLNGKLRQSSNTKNLIFPVPYLVKYVSRIMTLKPGDIITTGTPAGVGPMLPGDRIDIQIEGIGTLSNIVGSGEK